MERISFQYESIGRRRFRVRGHYADGRIAVLGEIEYRRFPHVRQYAWEATRADGHCGVHNEQWQAGVALVVVGQSNYPFPIIRPAWLT